MIRGRFAAAMAGIACCVQPAQAADAIFRGDCKRAEAIRQQRTVESLLPYQNYAGIERTEQRTDRCGREGLLSFELTLSSSTGGRRVYGLTQSNLFYNRKSGTCKSPEADPNPVQIGSLTFETRVEAVGDVCDFFLIATLYYAGAKAPTMIQRVLPLESGSFVIAQPPPDAQLRYWTPIAFTGIPGR